MGSCCCCKGRDAGVSSLPTEKSGQIAVERVPFPIEAVSDHDQTPAKKSDQVATEISASGAVPEFKPIFNLVPADINRDYILGEELGRGNFGIVYLCTNRITGVKFACKSISKRKLGTKKQIEDVQREILVLEHLARQPNIVEFIASYEDASNLHLVMELCSGGELFHRITERQNYSEQMAASIFRKIVNVIRACNFFGVIHRDLKPENFLMVSDDEDSDIKAADFGLAVFIKEGTSCTERVGTSYYMAPEVLDGRYGPEIDVWSGGVILYILLCGFPPFSAETTKGTFEAIRKGEIDFETPPWPEISPPAKDLIKKMLTRDPQLRITSEQALAHPWLKEVGGASDSPIENAVLIRMRNFAAMNRLKKLALNVIAEKTTGEEMGVLRKIFENVDTDKSGTITYEELRDGLRNLGSEVEESELRRLMNAADVDGNGHLDYEEFFTAIIHHHKLSKDENILKAFKRFDTDGSGFITREEMKAALTGGDSAAAAIDEILSEVDRDKDGKIDYGEFASMMRDTHHPALNQTKPSGRYRAKR